MRRCQILWNMIEVTSTGALLFAAHGHFFHSPSTVRIRIAVPRHALPMKRHFDSFAARPADPELGGMGRKPQVAWRYGLLAIESAGGASGAPGGLVKRSKVTESADIILCMLDSTKMYVVIRFPRNIPHDAVTNPQVRVVVAISNDVKPSVQGRLCRYRFLDQSS